MKSLLAASAALVLSATFLGCTTNSNVTVGGVPKWLADGAQLDSEPAPYRPDPAIIPLEGESGPVEFEMITDRRTYPNPPAAKKKAKSAADPIERGRDARIRRLVR